MTLRRANIERISGGHFDVLVVGAGIKARCRRRPSPAGRVGRADRPWRLRQLHEPGVVEPRVGRLQVPRELRAPPGVRAVPIAQPVDEGLPRQHQGDLLPRDARRDGALPTVVRRPRRHRVLGDRAVRHGSAAAVRRRARSRPRSRSSTPGPPRRDPVPGRLPRRQRLPLRLLVRPLGDRGRRGGRQLRRARAPPSGSATAGSCRLRDADSGDELTTTGTRASSTPPDRSSTSSTRHGACTTEHRIVYSKGIHLVVPRLTTTRHDRVLAFFDDTQRLFYVIPMGRRSVIGTTDTRVDTPFTEVTDEDRGLPARSDQRPARPPAAAHSDDIIAERSGVRPLVVARERSATRAAPTGPRSRAGTRSRGTPSAPSSRSSAASSPTASTSARRSPHVVQ